MLKGWKSTGATDLVWHGSRWSGLAIARFGTGPHMVLCLIWHHSCSGAIAELAPFLIPPHS